MVPRDVENSPQSPSERNSDNSTSGRGRGRGRSRGRGCGRGHGRGVVVMVGDKAIMKQQVHLQKRDGQRVVVCKFSLSQ